MEQSREPNAGCGAPPAPSDAELLAMIDGEDAADVTQHLRNCPACAARAEELAQLQQALRARLFRLFCPPSEQLLEYKEGLVTWAQRDAIAQHVATCPHCAYELAIAEYVVEYL
jgi:anti-sigma factor RsiW